MHEWFILPGNLDGEEPKQKAKSPRGNLAYSIADGPSGALTPKRRLFRC